MDSRMKSFYPPVHHLWMLCDLRYTGHLKATFTECAGGSTRR